MELVELTKLLGILIIIIGFALKKDAILIIVCSAIVTALVGGLGINGLLEVLGSSFVKNRSIAIFIIIIVVTATLERNGLKSFGVQGMIIDGQLCPIEFNRPQRFTTKDILNAEQER